MEATGCGIVGSEEVRRRGAGEVDGGLWSEADIVEEDGARESVACEDEVDASTAWGGFGVGREVEGELLPTVGVSGERGAGERGECSALGVEEEEFDACGSGGDGGEIACADPGGEPPGEAAVELEGFDVPIDGGETDGGDLE